ncbi:cation:proton antiporter [Corynebacterium felinum]|uniref:CPA1 family monovalent cation:H+ antiporter n=1 Tax=Corynebacterium felinum TaxID=131318 RepID=A0ABU2BCU1_9CORY|nr:MULTISPECIES: cation:proton antiporter [Corynebacterium]MDF5819723.1 cation:proton antiporter [Corynebacterium felinum]MDO4761892.1 cation:proton antiporter [Corynebacterium sp.]MDR7355558.1 CPA1 family monovalent cation:H+ antiporter [Corynebacterium felinum]WJY94908.1 Na(+)/H(+) antiporter ApNhaP [Corynebacterium felinum]
MEIMIALIGLLFATVIMVAIGDRTGLPWPALLTILAGGAILIPGIPDIPIPPELMLPIFIPPLLWALVRRTSWAAIRRNWREVILLAFILTVVSAFAVGFSAYLLIPTLSLAGAMMIGAAIAPTDPVAVDAVAEPAGVPRRLSNTLQNEGLFNDAASIVVFNLALGVIVKNETPNWWSAILTLIYSAGAAVIVGWIIGFVAAKLTDWMSSSVSRNAFTWIIPFATYLGAEAIHASGVVAIVFAAIEFNSRVNIGAEDRLSGTAFWQIVELLFTGMAFGLIGMTVRQAIDEVGRELLEAVWVGIVLSVVAIVVRLTWFYIQYKVNCRTQRKTGSPLRLQEVLLLSWAGMRGLITLALVMSIPASTNFALYRELPVIALIVLVITMVIPGLSLPWLMKKLSLDAGPDAFGDIAREQLVARARTAARSTMMSHIDELPQEKMQALLTRFEETIHFEDEDEDHMSPEARREMLRQHAQKMASIHLEALKAAQRELLNARKERDVDPAILDEVLFDVDQQILGVKKGIYGKTS